MKQYQSYKEANTFWLSEIPSHWQMTKIKYLFSERTEKGYPNEPLLAATQNMGVVPKNIYGQRTVEASKDLHLLKLVRVDDFVISLRSFQGGIEKAYYQGIISPAYTILIPNGISGKYFKHLGKSAVFLQLLKSCVTGIREGQNIDYQVLKNQKIPLPTLEEQEKIGYFLDWKISKTNHLINIKKKELKELDALKRSIASNAVTRGLNPDAPMKFSGVKWLGDIPEHWEIRKLREILRPVSVKNRPDLPLLSVVREQGVIVRDVEDKESNHNFIPDDLSGYKVVRKGQFAMNKMKAWQGSYGVSDYTGIVSPAYFIFDVAFDNLEYFHFAIRSKVYVNFFAQASDGIRVGQWDLKMNKMKEIPFIIPPAEEQIAIVKYVREAVQKYDEAIAKLSEQIAVLEEYKAKLISDVVTGKVDVRDVEIPEYEYVEELVDDAAAEDDIEESEDAE